MTAVALQAASSASLFAEIFVSKNRPSNVLFSSVISGRLVEVDVVRVRRALRDRSVEETVVDRDRVTARDEEAASCEFEAREARVRDEAARLHLEHGARAVGGRERRPRRARALIREVRTRVKPARDRVVALRETNVAPEG